MGCLSKQTLEPTCELLWLGVLYAIVPTALFALAFGLSWTYPLTARRHARLETKLKQREARLNDPALQYGNDTQRRNDAESN